MQRDGDRARLRLGVDAVDQLPVLGPAVAGPVVGERSKGRRKTNRVSTGPKDERLRVYGGWEGYRAGCTSGTTFSAETR